MGIPMTYVHTAFFFLFLKPEAARGNPPSSHRPILGSELGEKKEKQHEISGPGASGPPGARGHEEPPTGYVGRCSVPQLLLLVPSARFSVGNMHRTYSAVRARVRTPSYCFRFYTRPFATVRC